MVRRFTATSSPRPTFIVDTTGPSYPHSPVLDAITDPCNAGPTKRSLSVERRANATSALREERVVVPTARGRRGVSLLSADSAPLPPTIWVRSWG